MSEDDIKTASVANNKGAITEPAFLHSALKQKALDLLQVILAND